MKKTLIISIIFLLSISCLYSKDYHIKGKINSLRAMKIYIQDFYGKENLFYDSAKVSFSGGFEFILNDNNKPGLYRLRTGENFFLDFIFNRTDVSFETDYSAPVSAMKFINSPNNDSYYYYLRMLANFRKKIELLLPLIEKYPQNDGFYPKIIKQVESLKNEFVGYIDSVQKSKTDNFVKKLILCDRSYVLQPAFTKIFDKESLKQSFFDNIDFTNTTILYSETYANIIISYLSLFNDPSLGRTKQIAVFKQACDELLKRTAHSEVLYQFTVEFLINGFKQIHYNEVVDYVVLNNQVDNNCVNSAKRSELNTQIAQLKQTVIGSAAPAVVFTNFENEKLPLYSIKSDLTLIVFWASWCPHCKIDIPELASLAKANSDKLKVVMVSLDRNVDDARKAIEAYDAGFINVIETSVWDSPITNNFNVFATPTYFLLNSNMRIIDKPFNINDLKEVLNR